VDRLALRVAVALATVAGAAGIASAQGLPILHVRSFVLAVDRPTVAVGDPFHLTLTTHVDEKIGALEGAVLPNLSGFEDLGDERRCAPAGTGTTCVETLTLDAPDPGDKTIGPAAVEAIDPATGRPRNLESNLVTIHVTGQAKTTEEPPAPNPFADALGNVVRQLVVFVLVAVAAWALVWGFARRPVRPFVAPANVMPPVVAPAPVVPDDWATHIARLVAELEREPTRAHAVAVREALRQHVGAREKETLADLVARDAANGRTGTLAALAAVERAAFCEEERVPAAVVEALPYLKT
jgi:hypothetical protein